MVDFRIILRLVEFILCILYNGVALIVIPDCIEAVAFYAKIVTAAHVDVEEQIQSLKSVVVHILLGAVVINITLLKFGNKTEVNLLHREESCLCSRCQREEQKKKIQEGLLISEQIQLHKF